MVPEVSFNRTFLTGIIGFVVPVLAGAITNNNMTFSAWQLVFGPSAAIYTICNLVYIFTIDGKPQSWNFPESSDPDVDENNETLKLAPKAELEDTEKI